MRGPARRPHIVMLLADTLRADRLNCQGYGPRPTSRALDAIARGGVLFEHAIASAPWTLPSHGSLFTGMAPTRHGATDVTLRLRDDVETLAERLARAGYRTVAFTPRNGWLTAATGVMRGFGLHVEPKHRAECDRAERRENAGGALREEAGFEGAQVWRFAEYVLKDARAGGPPLFLFLHTMLTHEPYLPSTAAWDRLGASPPDADLFDYLRREFKTYRANPHTIAPDQADALRLLYDACVATVDMLCGRLFLLIQQHLGWRDTVFIVTSDHGHNLSEHGMWSHWLCLFDTLLHVPLLVYPRPAGLPARVPQQVQQSDLFHTLLHLAGCPGSQAEKGLLERAAGRAPFAPYAFAEHDHPVTTLRQVRRHCPSFSDSELESAKKMVRTAEHKLVLHSTGTAALYDLARDPGEEAPVLSAEPQVTGQLREAVLSELGPFTALPTDGPARRRPRCPHARPPPGARLRLSRRAGACA